jgi:putative FmdB family regulatory protein
MPLYEYQCQKCDTQFEFLVQGDEKVACPECAGTRLNRLLSLPGIPQVKTASAKMACNSSGPPCGSACSRLA